MELDTFGQMVDDLLHIATFFLAGLRFRGIETRFKVEGPRSKAPLLGFEFMLEYIGL